MARQFKFFLGASIDLSGSSECRLRRRHRSHFKGPAFGYTIDGGGRQVLDRPADANRPESEPIQDNARNGTTRTVGELVEPSPLPHETEGRCEYRHNRPRGHCKERQTTHRRVELLLAHEMAGDPRGIDIVSAGQRIALLQHFCEALILLDEGEASFVNTSLQKGAGKYSRPSSQFNDPSGGKIDLTGHQPGQRAA